MPIQSRFCAAILFALACQSAAGQQFTPGHYYSPVYGGVVVEWDQSLHEVRRFTVPGVSSIAGGTVFTDHNTLLIMGYRQNSAQVIEVNAGGSILQSYTIGGTLLTGSYLATDPGTGMYAFANGTHLTVLNQQLQAAANTPSDFVTAGGVAFDQSGHLFADDEGGAGIREYTFDGSSLSFRASHPALYFLNEGMQWCPDNTLLYVRSEMQDIARLSLADNTTTFIPIGLGFRTMNDVHQLPGGDLLLVANNRLYEYTASGQFVRQSTDPGDFTFGMAVCVPAPGSFLVCSGLLFAVGRRRR